VPKLDRFARSVADARQIGDSLVGRGVKLSLGGTLYDSADPKGMPALVALVVPAILLTAVAC
jgi:hypothetical protein